MKTGKRLLALALVFTCLISSGCTNTESGGGQQKEDSSAGCVLVSEDADYQFHIADNWTCWLTAVDSDSRLAEGSFSIREENSAVTIILNDVILDMDNGSDTYGFSYEDAAAGISTSFRVLRSKVLSDLDTTGVILTADDIGSSETGGEETPGTGGGPSGGGFSMTPSVILWNNGVIQLNIIKVQAEANYTYSKEEGFQVTQTERQENMYGKLGGIDNGDGTLTLTFENLVAQLPFGMSGTGSVTFRAADLDAALDQD